MGRDSDCQPPEWLNREFIAVALKPEYSGKSPRVASMTVENANKTQRGYTSRLYRVTAKVEVAAEAEVHAWHLIVKCTYETGIVSEVSRLQQLFPRETLMLTSLVPAVHEALRRLRAEAVGPRCLLAASSPVDVLVMEDLSAAGYGPPPAGFLDLEHCRLVLDRLAQWHAASCTLDLARPDSGADPLLRRDPVWQPPVASLLQPYHRKQFRSIGVALGNFPDCYKYSKKYKTDSEEWVDKIVHAVTRSCAQSDFKVLVHADVWNKNIMVKYRDGKPVDLRFVDFQVSHLASPARDLVFFLYGNASEQVHRHHLSDLLLEYHSALSAALRALGLQRHADAYPLHKLLADMDSLAMLALYCVCYAPLSTATDQRGVAIMDGLGVAADYSEALVRLYSDPTLISYWRFINPILEKMPETDERLPPPEWLDEKLVAQALRRAEQDEELEVEALDVGYACDRGVNFLSEMLRVTVSVKRCAGEARTQRRSLLAKCLLRAGPLRTVVQEAGIFLRETLVYTVMLPAAEAALQAAEGDRWKPLAARCYHSGSRPIDFLLLEDLAEAGFAMSPRGRLLDRQHCSLVLKTVARLHAASVLLADHEALAAESFSQHPMFTKYGRDHFSVVTDRLYSALADVLGTIAGCEKYALMYRDTKSTVFDKLQGVFDSCRPQLKVLAHGDLWKNNIMFRYVDDRPVDVRLVDFQNCFWSSPAADLQHFLGSSASLEVHQQHVEGLVSEYHAVLQGTLRALGLHRQADAYPLHQLRLDMDHFAAHTLCMASVMPPMILAPESLGKDAEEALNNSQRDDTFFRQIVSNPEFISRIKYVLPAYEKVGAM